LTSGDGWANKRGQQTECRSPTRKAMNLFRRKSVTDLQAEALTDQSLKRALGPLNLTTLGIGAIIGTGIFVLTGTAAAQNAGPAVVLSFIFAGIASAFAALCYSEFASLVPMSGSAYTYGYATLGEVFAWIIGWDLTLEYAVGAIAVSVGWSGYVVSFLRDFGIQIPPELSAARGTHLIDIPAALAAVLKIKAGWAAFGASLADQIRAVGTDPAILPQVTAIFNLPAIIIVAVVTTLLVIGIKDSAGVNNLIVFVKLAVVVLFILGAIRAINPANWHPFIPPNTGKWGEFGWSGVMRGASLVFFAYIGFDAVSTAAQEAKNPQKDMPVGIIGSLLVCTVLYILVSGIATGVTPYRQLDVPEPIAMVADHANLGWMARLIKLGAIAGLSSVILVMMLGQTRVFWTMSRDGLLPPFVSAVHPRFKTPWVITIATGIVVAFFGAVLPVRDAGNLCNIGTLLAFVIVSVGVLVLRVREPGLERKFKTPWIWFVAPMGALSSFSLMLYLPLMTWVRLLVWFLLGIIIYASYGFRHSKLAETRVPPAQS
jgi:APA family basic amino acid/polyamine antiporter